MIKTREEAARFAEKQFSWQHKCSREKGGAHHYGLQELRELMDFIYQGPPAENESIRPREDLKRESFMQG